MNSPLEVSIEYPGGVTDKAALVTALGDGRFRLELDPLSCLIAERPRDRRKLPNYGDVIEAVYVDARTLRFVRVVERAPLKKYSFLVSKDVADLSALEAILGRVEALDGHWERVFGGVLILCLPEDSTYDPSKGFKQLGENA